MRLIISRRLLCTPILVNRKEHLCHLAEYTDLEEQAHGTGDSVLADAE